ncbi:hypothetical protein [Leyella stercorea]|uniref:hypothetical protein n=1 Tax=Leyella stercorea TaxID=363265 RepID=UPI003AB70FEF
MQTIGGYGILPYPRTHRTIFPQKPQKPQKFLAQDILPQNPRNTQKRLAQDILPQIADVHRLGGYGIPAIPTQPPNYLPTEATEPTEVSDARYSPTDCTNVHRLGGYGILPYPRRHQTIFPQKPQKPQKFLTQDILPQIAQIYTD